VPSSRKPSTLQVFRLVCDLGVALAAMNHLHAELLRELVEFQFRDQLPDFVGGLAGDFLVLDGTVADVNQPLLGEMGNQTGIRAVFDDRRGAGLRPFGNHLPKIHVPPVKRHLLRRGALGIFIRVPQLDRRVDVEHAAVVAPLEEFAAVNVPREVNQHVAGGKVFAQQRAHVFARHLLADELYAALEPRCEDAATVLKIHDGDVFGRRFEVFDQNGQRALRHGTVADEQDFIFEFEHDNNPSPALCLNLFLVTRIYSTFGFRW